MVSEKSRILLKLGKEAVGYRLATDIVSSDGRVLAPKGVTIDPPLMEGLLRQGITVVLIEPKSTDKPRQALDHMFSRHLNDPLMLSLYKAAVNLLGAHRIR